MIRDPEQQQMAFNFFTVLFISSDSRGRNRVNRNQFLFILVIVRKKPNSLSMPGLTPGMVPRD